jgi:hypothetical protein
VDEAGQLGVDHHVVANAATSHDRTTRRSDGGVPGVVRSSGVEETPAGTTTSQRRILLDAVMAMRVRGQRRTRRVRV